MFARWTQSRVPGQIQPTMRLALRVGALGKGKIIKSVQYWTESDRSRDEAESVCLRIEEDAKAQGYIVLPDGEKMC